MFDGGAEGTGGRPMSSSTVIEAPIFSHWESCTVTEKVALGLCCLYPQKVQLILWPQFLELASQATFDKALWDTSHKSPLIIPVSVWLYVRSGANLTSMLKNQKNRLSFPATKPFFIEQPCRVHFILYLSLQGLFCYCPLKPAGVVQILWNNKYSCSTNRLLFW